MLCGLMLKMAVRIERLHTTRYSTLSMPLLGHRHPPSDHHRQLTSVQPWGREDVAEPSGEDRSMLARVDPRFLGRDVDRPAGSLAQERGRAPT
jgi:hypothetical protein